MAERTESHEGLLCLRDAVAEAGGLLAPEAIPVRGMRDLAGQAGAHP